MWDGLLTLVIGIVVIPIIVVRGLFRLAGLKRVEDVLPPPQRDGRTSSPRANELARSPPNMYKVPLTD
jgi:hypothetical protein